MGDRYLLDAAFPDQASKPAREDTNAGAYILPSKDTMSFAACSWIIKVWSTLVHCTVFWPAFLNSLVLQQFFPDRASKPAREDTNAGVEILPTHDTTFFSAGMSSCPLVEPVVADTLMHRVHG